MKHIKTIRLIGRIIATLLILILLEGVMTLGHAFRFEDYTIGACVLQSIILIVALVAALLWHHEEEYAEEYTCIGSESD